MDNLLPTVTSPLGVISPPYCQAERGSGRSGGFTPPESPRTGAVRGPTTYAALDGVRGAVASSTGGELWTCGNPVDTH